MANRDRIFGAKPRVQLQQGCFYDIGKPSTTLTTTIPSVHNENQPQQCQYMERKSRPTTRIIRNSSIQVIQNDTSRHGNQTFIYHIERERSKSRGRSRSYGDAGEGRNRERGHSARREKFLPPKKVDTELFDESQLIKEGKFAYAFDEDVFVLNQDGNKCEIKKLEEFAECQLSKEMLKNLDLKHYHRPTAVQKVVIPIIQNTRSDLIGHAPTGSGKTAAFLLPIINELQNIVKNHNGTSTSGNSPYMIIISPAKELAEQLANDARAFAIQTGVTVTHTYGDIPIRPSLDSVAAGCDIFVSTCGRLQHFVEEGWIKLDELRYLVLDEADKLLKLNTFYNCIKTIKEHRDINPAHRVLMFSATYELGLNTQVQEFLRDDFFQIQVGQKLGLNSAAITVSQIFLKVYRHVDKDSGQMNKEETLRRFLVYHKNTKFIYDPHGEDYFKVPKTIVFVERRRESYRLTMALRDSNIRAFSINGNFTLKMRWNAVNQFQNNEVDVLVSTDVLARGMNFSNLEYVINYDLPVRDSRGTQEEYIHRIGRTGRLGNYGSAISYFDPSSEYDVRNAPYYAKVLAESGIEVPDWLSEIANAQMENSTGMPKEKESTLRSSANDKKDSRNGNHPDDPFQCGMSNKPAIREVENCAVESSCGW